MKCFSGLPRGLCCLLWAIVICAAVFIGGVACLVSMALYQRSSCVDEVRSRVCEDLGLKADGYTLIGQSVDSFLFGPSFYYYALAVNDSWSPPEELAMAPVDAYDEATYDMTVCNKEFGIAFSPDTVRSGFLDRYWYEIDLLYCPERSVLWVKVEYPLEDR